MKKHTKKECRKCKSIKSIDEFYSNGNGGRRSRCKSCEIIISSTKPKIKICKHCLSEFKPYTSLDKFCSANCRIGNIKSKRNRNWGEGKAEKIKGMGNPAYRNGYYSISKRRSWAGEREYLKTRDLIRDKMISEYGYLFCEHCKTNNSFQWEMHHIVFRSEKPNHKNLHNERNLINLCMGCHNKFHSKKSMRSDLVKKRNLVEIFGSSILNK